jgi:hypothetical protein
MPTLGEYTLQELKNAIDTAITNKNAIDSITPAIDGAVRKEVVEDLFLKIQNIQSSGTPTFNFPADASLNIANDKHKLVMNDGGVAKLLNYAPPTPGVKGKYKITLQAPTKTIGAIWEMQFPNNLDEDDVLSLIYIANNQAQTFNSIAKNTPINPNEFQIGATIADTINNIISHTNSLGIIGDCWELSITGTDILKIENKSIWTNTPMSVTNDYALPEMYNSQYPGYIMLSISTNGGANNNSWTATQVQLGEKGAYAEPYIDYILAQNQNGNVLEIGNSNGNQYIPLLPFIQNSVSAAADYMGWNMANSDTEFAQIYFDAFNAQGYFVATDLGINGNAPNEFIIEEAVAQTGTNIYLNINPIYNDFLSNVFYNTLITTPQAGLGMSLKKRLLGSLEDVVGGEAKINSSNTITGKLAAGVDVSYADDVDWTQGVQDLNATNTLLVPAPNGELIDYLTLVGLGHSQDTTDIIFLGQVYLALENKTGGNEILVRPIILGN